MKISEQELEIFSRHLILKDFHEDFFNKFQTKKITLIGVGGIGCPAIQYLVAAGIKKIKIIDSDIIEKSNLNRQTLFSINDIGLYKSEVAKNKLLDINPECKIESFSIYLNQKNSKSLLEDSSLIIDATDNWNSMTIINKFCVENSIPLISASAIGFDSQVILFNNKQNDHLCLKCIFPNNSEPNLARCDTVGILGTAAGIAGLIVAQKIINFFLDKKNVYNYITMVNLKSLNIEKIKIKKNPNCKLSKK